MLLMGPDLGYRPVKPALLQKVSARTDVALPAFGVATSVGDLLVWIGVTRSGLTSGHPDQDTWTDLIGHSVGFPRDDNTNENSMEAWGLVVPTSRSAYTRTLNRSTGTLWHIPGGGLAGLTEIDLSDQAASTVHDLGSLGTLAADRIALMCIGAGQDLNNTWTITPGVWTSDFLASRDTDASNADSFFGQNFPYSWFGHTAGTGVAARARVDANLSNRWGGICILLA